jgi:hypothetical protein
MSKSIDVKKTIQVLLCPKSSSFTVVSRYFTALVNAMLKSFILKISQKNKKILRGPNDQFLLAHPHHSQKRRRKV